MQFPILAIMFKSVKFGIERTIFVNVPAVLNMHISPIYEKYYNTDLSFFV